jgi:hypothetical protein
MGDLNEGSRKDAPLCEAIRAWEEHHALPPHWKDVAKRLSKLTYQDVLDALIRIKILPCAGLHEEIMTAARCCRMRATNAGCLHFGNRDDRDVYCGENDDNPQSDVKMKLDEGLLLAVVCGALPEEALTDSNGDSKGTVRLMENLMQFAHATDHDALYGYCDLVQNNPHSSTLRKYHVTDLRSFRLVIIDQQQILGHQVLGIRDALLQRLNPPHINSLHLS